MPLTDVQSEIARLLAANRSHDSYLAGGAALHIEPNGRRYSNDLDFFHDSSERVASAYESDARTLAQAGFACSVRLRQPTFIQAVVSRGDESTKVEWVHESAYRFLPVVEDARCGFIMHPIDLAINKVLALVGRNEVRDFFDVLYTHEQVLPLGAQCWAACGKDPGYSPRSLLTFLRRRGLIRPEDVEHLAFESPEPIDLVAVKQRWLRALDSADQFVRSRPPEEHGCLYYDPAQQRFVEPTDGQNVVCHYGRPGGVLPTVSP